jgi:hypothetical protein
MLRPSDARLTQGVTASIHLNGLGRRLVQSCAWVAAQASGAVWKRTIFFHVGAQ